MQCNALVLALFSIAAPMGAFAQSAATVNEPITQVRLCPATDCARMAIKTIKSGNLVTVQEVRDNFARVSTFYPKSRFAAVASGGRLSDQVAMWVSLTSLTLQAVADQNNSAKEAPKPPVYVALPKVAPLPQFRPSVGTVPAQSGQITSSSTSAADNTADPATTTVGETTVDTASAATNETTVVAVDQAPTPVVEEIDASTNVADQAAASDQKATVVAKPLDPSKTQKSAAEILANKELEAASAALAKQAFAEETVIEEVASAEVPVVDDSGAISENTTGTQTAALEPEAETIIQTPSADKRPKKLTKELMDPRLADLPDKPGFGITKDDIIALRHYGLQLVNNGTCDSIAEGGLSLSLQGWLYVRCSDDYQIWQFEK